MNNHLKGSISHIKHINKLTNLFLKLFKAYNLSICTNQINQSFIIDIKLLGIS